MKLMARRKYHLQVCPGEGLQGPTDSEIADSVRSLPGGVPSFVILTKGKNDFMQAGGSKSEAFQLEYQEISRDGHWEHEESGNVPEQIVVQALQWYAQDDARWRTNLKWRRLSRAERQAKNQTAWKEWRETEPRDNSVKSLIRVLGRLVVEEFIPGNRKRR